MLELDHSAHPRRDWPWTASPVRAAAALHTQMSIEPHICAMQQIDLENLQKTSKFTIK